jgi:hypothetical protein
MVLQSSTPYPMDGPSPSLRGRFLRLQSGCVDFPLAERESPDRRRLALEAFRPDRVAFAGTRARLETSMTLGALSLVLSLTRMLIRAITSRHGCPVHLGIHLPKSFLQIPKILVLGM